MRTKLAGLVAGLSVLSLAVPVVAHHGFDTEYDAKKKVSLADVITKIEWTNPHMHLYIDVTDTDGNVANWNLEMASPNTVRRQGWGRNSVLPGDEVVFEGYAGLVVETRGALARIATAAAPDEPLFVQGGPAAAPGFPER